MERCPICGSLNYSCRNDMYARGSHMGVIIRKETFDMALKLTKDLWLNADKTKAVEESDPDARYLLGRKGDEISDQDAELYGLVVRKKAPSGPSNKER